MSLTHLFFKTGQFTKVLKQKLDHRTSAGVSVANADGCSDNVDGDSSSNVVDVDFIPEAVACSDEVVLIPELMRSMFTVVDLFRC